MIAVTLVARTLHTGSGQGVVYGRVEQKKKKKQMRKVLDITLS